MEKTEKTDLGTFGEERAADFLKKHAYRIIARNFKCKTGEIDIIAEKDEYVIFAEVKLRKNRDFGEAREFVTPAKQRRVIRAAQYWMALRRCARQPRFDVIEVYAPEGRLTPSPEIIHIENAYGINY